MNASSLNQLDWNRRSVRFYAMGTAFLACALAHWSWMLTERWQIVRGPAGCWIEMHGSPAARVSVVAATIGWGAFVSLLLAAGSRRDASLHKVLGFAVLAGFLGWDAVWRLTKAAMYLPATC